MFLGIIFFVVSLVLLVRLSLIIVGLHKGPVLETFERYGDEDPFYYPWPQMSLLLGVFLIGFSMMLDDGSSTLSLMSFIGLLLILLSWGIYSAKKRAHETMERFSIPHVPFWLSRLSENTTRYERRRIAYMWLHLPVRTRLLYNASDRHFFLWAELVIMATTREA